MYLIMFVLHNAERLEELLDAWEDVGVGGVTILHSSGLGRVRTYRGIRDDLPLMPSLESLLQHEEYFSRTLFSVVDSDDVVDKIVKTTQKVVGDLSRSETGLLVVMPAIRAYGLEKIRS